MRVVAQTALRVALHARSPEHATALGLYKQWFWAHEFGQAMVVPASTATQAAVQQWGQAGSRLYYLRCEE
jgi:hypothetical protein